ncbi:MAG: PEP-CTERM sorting domain-containing protein, partial [Cyanobacteriota bacterium]
PVENGGGDTPPPVDDDVVSVPEPSAVSGILMLGLGLLKMSRNRKVIKR